MALHVAMIVPPISDLNTLYAAAPRLAGWLRKLGHQVRQIDLSLELFLRMYSRNGLERMFAAVRPELVTLDLEDVYDNRDRYIRIIDEVISFAQGRDLTLMHRIVRGDLLPTGPRFQRERADRRRAAFGDWGRSDLARHLVALMLFDLTDLFKTAVSPHYNLTNYGEKLAEARVSFDPIEDELRRAPNVIEQMIMEVASEHIPEDIDLACFTCPFPGQLLGSLFLGKWLKTHRPRAQRALGGGYPSTELRKLSDPRIFDYVDYLVLDDGEVPLQQICARVEGKPETPLERTFTREGDVVVYHKSAGCASPRFRELPAPDYTDVAFNRYIHVIFRRNQVSRLLTEGAWLKLTAAHGCYWKKCTFCDIHLSYIEDFDPLPAATLADQMDTMHQQTGMSGFHFTDEAAPPPLLVQLSVELLRRQRTYQFWGNVRFDVGFTPDRCRVLAAAGLVAVTGGIEIASDELLPKIAKGITVKQVIKVLQAFSMAGVITHAYLIYGFPGETRQDTINSLEILRQMMRAKILRSAVYHIFAATLHSPIGKNPEVFGIRLRGPEHRGFATYNMHFTRDKIEPNEEEIHGALHTAMDDFARGDGLDRPVRDWLKGLDFPAPTIEPDFVEKILALPFAPPKSEEKMLWLGGVPRWRKGLLTVSLESGEIVSMPAPKWVAENLSSCHPASWQQSRPPTVGDFERQDWYQQFRARGLVLI